MIAVTPKDDWEWASAGDMALPAEERTVWILGDLRERDRVRLNDAVMVRQDDVTGAVSGGIGTRIYLTLKAGLRGIKDGYPFPDENGEHVPFDVSPNGQVSDTFLERIEYSVQQEMFVAITARLSMDESEKEE